MSQRSLLWPVVVVCIMVVMVFSALAGPASSPAAMPSLQYPAYPVQATNTPPATDTAIPTASVNPTATATTDATADTDPTATLQATTTPTATATTAPRGDAPTLTPTPTLGPDVEVLSCIPGAPVVIEGDDAPPLSYLLLFFDRRAVGGGISNDDGAYRLRLVPGEERPGLYPVTVRTRDTRDIIQELACEVNGATATPTTFVVSPTPLP